MRRAQVTGAVVALVVFCLYLWIIAFADVMDSIGKRQEEAREHYPTYRCQGGILQEQQSRNSNWRTLQPVERCE